MSPGIAQFLAQTFSQCGNSELSATVGRVVATNSMSNHAVHVDDMTVLNATILHDLESLSSADAHCNHIDVEHVFQLLLKQKVS